MGILTRIGEITFNSSIYRATGFESFRPAQISNGAAISAKSQKLGLRNPSIVNTNHILRRRKKSGSLLNRIATGLEKRNIGAASRRTTISAFTLLNIFALGDSHASSIWPRSHQTFKQRRNRRKSEFL
jgi:hypothetical protein